MIDDKGNYTKTFNNKCSSLCFQICMTGYQTSWEEHGKMVLSIPLILRLIASAEENIREINDDMENIYVDSFRHIRCY